ncbi:MAG TPA: PASTA domain-containing protein, partial [Stackebrandtia sp.]|uniref:PASTA domain-containing protein n=1 Tax=Stackebrandtia sp. TaxID=2023065 RepID=UPI002D44027D
PPPENPPPPRPKRRRGVFLVICLAALIFAVAAVTAAATRPWELATHGIDTAEKTDGLAAQPGGDGHGAGGGAKGDDTGSSHRASRSASTSGAASGAKSSAPGSSTSPSPDTVTVPNVLNETEADARRDLTAAGLRPAVIYEGDGDVTCTVTGQDPAGGTQAGPDSSVTITVRKAKDRCSQ